MTKTELVSEISIKTGMPRDAAQRALNAALQTIEASLSRGEPVTIPGFGTFSVKHRGARKGHNVRTGEEIEIPAAEVPAFKPGKTLKETVN